MKVYQQGDVIIEEMSNSFDDFKGVKPHKSKVLFEGELKGHAHVLEGKAEIITAPGIGLAFRNSEPVQIKHDEHEAITVPPGTYYARRVRETDYFSKEEIHPALD